MRYLLLTLICINIFFNSVVYADQNDVYSKSALKNWQSQPPTAVSKQVNSINSPFAPNSESSPAINSMLGAYSNYMHAMNGVGYNPQEELKMQTDYVKQQSDAPPAE